MPTVPSAAFLPCLLAALAAGLVPAQDPPRPLPAFDHQLAGRDGAVTGIPATWVVTLPDGYRQDQKDRSWPLILDFHGAIAPTQKGAEVTRDRLWSKATGHVPAIVVGLNGRTRAWGTIEGERDDVAFALAVLRLVQAEFAVDEKRIYLCGFSSGADFLCQGRLQQTGLFAASMPICSGPPNVVGLKNGALVAKKDRPFCFVTGEADHIRKDGAWQAFLAFEQAGGRAMYREVPDVAHAFPPPAEYGHLFAHLELLTRPWEQIDHLAVARAALQREDFLLASTHLLREGSDAAKELLAQIEQKGRELTTAAQAIDATKAPGAAFEAWWRVRTQCHRFPELAQAAQTQLEALQKLDGRTLGRARAAFFKERAATRTGR